VGQVVSVQDRTRFLLSTLDDLIRRPSSLGVAGLPKRHMRRLFGLLFLVSLSGWWWGLPAAAAAVDGGERLAAMLPDGRLLCVVPGAEAAAPCRWRVIGPRGVVRDLGYGAQKGGKVFEILPSPDGCMLAVVSASEGHPFLEVFAVEPLRQEGRWALLWEFNPYPGTVALAGWHDGRLRLETDNPLALVGCPAGAAEELWPDLVAVEVDPRWGSASRRRLRAPLLRWLAAAWRESDGERRVWVARRAAEMQARELLPLVMVAVHSLAGGSDRDSEEGAALREAQARLRQVPMARPAHAGDGDSPTNIAPAP
jgi:hypothetical protein